MSQEKSEKQLVFWHFSDLHWSSGSSSERESLMNVLLKDLHEKLNVYGQPAFCVVTGDIAYAGKQEEYTQAQEDFFDQIREIVDDELPILTVPGNHDQNREIVETITYLSGNPGSKR